MPKLYRDPKHPGLAEFLCPACGYIHQVAIAPNSYGFPVWVYNGDDEHPTIAPSIRVDGEWKGKKTCCHSFVRDGKIQFLSDCTHKMAGQVMELPEHKI